MTRKPGRDPSVQPSRSRYGASYPHPILKYWCALNTTSPGQPRGRAGASLLTGSPTVPACRPAYAAATCHWATCDRHTGVRLLLCNIARTHPYPQGFVAFGLDRLSPIGTQTSGPSQSPPLSLIARGRACLCDGYRATSSHVPRRASSECVRTRHRAKTHCTGSRARRGLRFSASRGFPAASWSESQTSSQTMAVEEYGLSPIAK